MRNGIKLSIHKWFNPIGENSKESAHAYMHAQRNTTTYTTLPNVWNANWERPVAG